MSYVVSNLQVPEKPFTLDADAVENLTVEEFDNLSLSDQIHIYNQHRDVYDVLTGRTAPKKAEETKTDAQRFCDEFEARVDEALKRNFHPDEA